MQEHRKLIGHPPSRPVAVLGPLVALAIAALVAGCAAGSSATVQVAAPPASASTPGEPGTVLNVVIDDGAGKTDTWTLTCGPTGGSHPHAAAACAALAANGKKAIPPVPAGLMCTQIFGGAQKAKITGTWDGAAVDATFSRQNGCEINRWKALEGLLPAAGGAGAG